MTVCLRHVIPILLVLIALVRWSQCRVTMQQMGQDIRTTRHGKVRGVLVQFPNQFLRSVVAYLGIQYASLLGGSMRFMPPTNPMEKWNGVRVLLKHRDACPQRRLDETTLSRTQPRMWREHLRRIAPFVERQSEDCLTLNLYVPRPIWNATEKMAVMVFIHGETFEIGTGNAYDGSVLASYGNVIVVTLNYRLGVLGFLNTGQEGTTGNYAIMDQMAALHWIQENIHSFNGDPERVTIFGHGHGAALVNILLVTPVTSDGLLFRRAILQSGSALSTWSRAANPIECTKRLATKVNCSKYVDDVDKLLSCLRNKSYVSLVDNAPLPPKYYACFGPSVNPIDSLLPQNVRKLLKNPLSLFSKADLMLGVTNHEAYGMLSDADINSGISTQRRDQIIRTYVQNVFRFQRQKIFDLLQHYYTDWDRNVLDKSYRDGVMELLSDGQYVAPIIKLANEHRGKGNTYLYNFEYTSDEKPYPLPNWTGSAHGEELPYVFGAPLVAGVSPFRLKYSKTDKMISEAMMRYWSNFAKTGDPNKPESQISVHSGRVKNRFVKLSWPQYDVANQEYIKFDKRPRDEHHYRAKKVALWLDLIPKIHKKTSNPDDHKLKNSQNKSTFDSPDRILTGSVTIFPPPPPSPPTPPPKGKKTTDYSQFHHLVSHNTSHNSSLYIHRMTGNPILGRSKTTQTPDTGSVSHIHNFIPMSITISVGVGLLVLNILIFAGIYYQRERIRKIKLAAYMDDNNDMAIKRKLDRDSGGMGPESVSLLRQHNAPLAPLNSYEDNTKQNVINTDTYAVPMKPKQVSPSQQYPYSSPSGNGTYSMQRHAGSLPRDPNIYTRNEPDRSRTLESRGSQRTGTPLQNSTTAV